jgi:hypothetical protein
MKRMRAFDQFGTLMLSDRFHLLDKVAKTNKERCLLVNLGALVLLNRNSSFVCFFSHPGQSSLSTKRDEAFEAQGA